MLGNRYLSMNHLPTRQGFDSFIGFLTGMQASYTSGLRWKGEEYFPDSGYFTNLCGDAAYSAVEQHDADTPMFLYLPWYATHNPYIPAAPGWAGPLYEGLLWAVDVHAGRLRTLLEEKGMWSNLLFVYSSDSKYMCIFQFAAQGPLSAALL
jgi:arylsulfatase B